MATPPVWRRLPMPTSADLPNLLVSTTFTATSYTIFVTDLANIWSESLDRRAIYKRSLNESTSIDPTDSDSNMRAFLSKIRSVFDPSHRDHDKASMSISTRSNKEAGEQGLTMSITCELDNMQPLEWPVYLQKCPQSELTTELIVPLAQANSVGHRQVESLAETIKQKDAVIMKLLDKLEATGTRLEKVFAVLSAKQKPTRKMAEQKVKGLAPFSFEDWKAQSDDGPEDVLGVIESIFGGDGLEYSRKVDVVTATPLDGWWAKPESLCIPIVGPKTRSRSSQPATSLPESEREGHGHSEPANKGIAGEDQDDDFQVQSTPPHLMPNRKRSVPPPSTHDDDSTEDEDESHIPDSVPVPPEEPIISNRLGTIGMKDHPKTATRSPVPEDPVPATPASDTETASEDGSAASVVEISPPLKPAAGKIKGGLGRIGGGSTSHSKTPESPKKGALGRIGGERQRSKSPEPPKKTGMGRIGRGTRSSKTPEPKAEDAKTRGRSKEDVEPSARLRETSQERADRKRDELQKEIQKKATTGPARKKRKF
ncbi:XRCC4-like factor-domain-containing protein [Colletotrichum godetiae]|uniref:Non-homologous end-joining factor 1 n=1 Tax=Colletotrichum godetiae TaxID=1209918 RepID=A0AAJ0A780_9PEZI|nr:XRCC4-like factor-domain-containing protein [Colletotrichum godetiae]KAK1657329.1 XRCC4-like factor-domain-containing protein [Colletotrichum godetiae]